MVLLKNPGRSKISSLLLPGVMGKYWIAFGKKNFIALMSLKIEMKKVGVFNIISEYKKSLKILDKQLKVLKNIDITSTFQKRVELAVVLGEQSWFLRLTGEYKPAKEKAEKAINILKGTKYNDKSEEMYLTEILEGIKSKLAAIFWENGKYRKGIVLYKANLKFYRKLKNDVREIDSLLNLGFLYSYLFDFEKSEMAFKKALELGRRISQLFCIEVAYGGLGNIYYQKGEYKNAIKFYKKQVALSRRIQEKSGIASGLSNLGLVYLNLNKLDIAEKYLKKSLIINKEIGYLKSIALNKNNFGILYSRKEKLKKAEKSYQDFLEISRKLKNKRWIGGALGNLGNIYMKRGEYKRAEHAYKEKLKLNKSINDLQGMGTSYKDLGILFHEYKKYSNAEKNLKKTIEIFKKHKDRFNLITVYIHLANIALEKPGSDKNKRRSGRLFAQKALNLSKKMNLIKKISESKEILKKFETLSL